MHPYTNRNESSIPGYTVILHEHSIGLDMSEAEAWAWLNFKLKFNGSHRLGGPTRPTTYTGRA